MNNLWLFWYINGGAYIATVIALAVVGYIWYDSRQKGIEAKTWLIIASVGLALTLPATWAASNPLRLIALELSGNGDLYLYLGPVGLGISAFTGFRYYQIAQGDYISPSYPATSQMPPPSLPQEYRSPPITSSSTVDIAPSYTAKKSHSFRGNSPPWERTRQMHEPAQAVAWLVMRSGSRKGKGYPLDGSESLIGRDGQRCQIVLDHDSVSGQHAKIRMEHNRFWLNDLASTNGTYHNKERIQRVRLEDGDEIRFGSLKFKFKEVR